MHVPCDHPERVVLTGFMGSGKTTLGRMLADALGWAFADLDTTIEQRTGLTVPEIFARDGEPSFRTLESEALRTLLVSPSTVIALGGGAPETAVNRGLLQHAPATCVLYLAAPFAELEERCRQQANDPAATPRPNLANTAQAQERYHRRDPLYAAIAHHRVETSGLTPEETLAHILALLPASLRN